MKLKIISPENEHEFDVVWVDIETGAGSFVILEGHAPMIVTIEPNKQIGFCLKNGKQEMINCDGGVAEIDRDWVKILLNSDQPTLTSVR
jgi:F0F1-type ATP synthase, epsilon subunit (mitochondrial delta subunit)